MLIGGHTDDNATGITMQVPKIKCDTANMRKPADAGSKPKMRGKGVASGQVRRYVNSNNQETTPQGGLTRYGTVVINRKGIFSVEMVLRIRVPGR